MPATVHVLHPKPESIGSFLRVGHTGHRKLESLIAASRLRFRRFVFDASHIEGQRDLLGILRHSGCEIVLDPNLAETAAPGRGATATGTATRSFIEASRSFHDIGKPIIADFAGGFCALAAAAFGGIGGLCHGVGQKEASRIGDWRKKSAGGGGSAKRIYVVELDRYLTEGQLGVFFSVRGTKARFCCNDTTCCAHGAEDMIENLHRHFAIQRSKQINELSEIPEPRRAEHFLLHVLDPAVRSARLAARLKLGDDQMTKIIADAKKRLINLRDPLGDLHAKSAAASRSPTPKFRGENQSSLSAAG